MILYRDGWTSIDITHRWTSFNSSYGGNRTEGRLSPRLAYAYGKGSCDSEREFYLELLWGELFSDIERDWSMILYLLSPGARTRTGHFYLRFIPRDPNDPFAYLGDRFTPVYPPTGPFSTSAGLGSLPLEGLWGFDPLHHSLRSLADWRGDKWSCIVWSAFLLQVGAIILLPFALLTNKVMLGSQISFTSMIFSMNITKSISLYERSDSGDFVSLWTYWTYP